MDNSDPNEKHVYEQLDELRKLMEEVSKESTQKGNMDNKIIDDIEDENRNLLAQLTDLKEEHANTLGEIFEHLDDLEHDLDQLQEALSGAQASIRCLRKLR